MTTAYLKWKSDGPVDELSNDDEDPGERGETDDEATDDEMADPQQEEHPDYLNVTFPIIDVYELRQTMVVQRRQTSDSFVEDLVLHGLIPNTPVNPSIGFTIRTLELYRRLRMRQASFSIQAFVKVVCDLYAVSETKNRARRMRLTTDLVAPLSTSLPHDVRRCI